MINDNWQTAIKSAPRIGGFFISLIGLPFACSIIILCALDGAAILTTAGLIADSGNTLFDNFNSIDVAEKKARYYACLLRGKGELTCREEAGIEGFTGE